MKDGTRYAGKLKKTFAALKSKTKAPALPETGDPLYKLAVATLGQSIGDSRARRAIERLLANMVDWNEVRASVPGEVFKALDMPLADGPALCAKLVALLQAIFDREHKLSLDSLTTMARRQAKQYLETLDGTNEYVVASVVLWGLGGHAIPVDDRLLKELRSADVVHPDATRAQVQAFLERHIGAADAKLFCVLMNNFKANKRAATKAGKPKTRRATKKRKVVKKKRAKT